MEQDDPAVGRQADIALEAVDRALERRMERRPRAVRAGIPAQPMSVEQGSAAGHTTILAPAAGSAVTVR